MSSSDIALAISQVQRVAGLCNFLESPQLQAVRNSYPVTMPPDWGSGGFDLPLWMGLGNAHNFAGLTDVGYATKKRHVIVTGTPVTLSSGAQFNGIQLNLGIGDLRFYSVKAEETLRAFL